MGLAVACGSVFLGVATVTGWAVWRLRRFRALGSPRRSVLSQRLAHQRRAVSRLHGRLEQKLLKAGYRASYAAPAVITVRITALGLGGGLGVWAFGQGWPMSSVWIAVLGATAAGWLLPEWWLSARIGKRAREINRYLPDMLDLLVICLEAGLGFNAALVKVASELEWTSPVLSDELQYTIREIQMGRPRAVALRSLGKRCAHQAFSALLAVIIQAEKFGMSLARTLRTQVEGMRTARRQKVQEQVNKLPVKMVFPLVFFIFPELIVVIIGPAAVNIWLYYIKGLAN